MKIIQNGQSKLFLYVTILLVSFAACTHSIPSNQSASEVPNVDKANNLTLRIDPSLQLKFTTGVRAILEDRNGYFWFGSHQEGVCLFDGKKLTYFTVDDGLSNNQVRSIYEDSEGIIWFECGEGISSYDGNKIKTHTEKNYQSKNNWQITENDLWFKGDEATGNNEREGHPGVYRYDGHTLTYHVFPVRLNEGEEFYFSVSTPFVKGKNGMVWFGTYGAAIGYDGSSFTIIDDQWLGLNEETGFLHIRSIFEDSKGNLWIGNNGIGVYLYDGVTMVHFSKLHDLISENSLGKGSFRSPSGSLEHVFSMGEDRNGIMWFGDRDTGAWSYDSTSGEFENYTMDDGLTSTHIWQIYKDKRGELWFAMGDGSVCRFNGELFYKVL